MIDYLNPTVAEHGDALNDMARRCFLDTFEHLYRPEDLQVFLAQAYGPEGLRKDLADPHFDWRIAMQDGAIAAYVKLGPLGVPAKDPQPGALELRQLYVLKPWQGAGIAPVLMDWAIERAGKRGAPELYLSVFDHNHRAKRFYTRYGFFDVGPCDFRVGEQIDEDRMWKRPL